MQSVEFANTSLLLVYRIPKTLASWAYATRILSLCRGNTSTITCHFLIVETDNFIIFCKCVATKKLHVLFFSRNKSRRVVCATTSVTQSLPLLWPQDGGADGHKTGSVLLHASLPRCTGVLIQCARPVVESSGRGECISSGHKLVW